MKIIIIGGAGFIGINCARYFAEQNDQVVIFDNFSRQGTRQNIHWLKESFPAVEIVEGDIRSEQQCTELFKQHADAQKVLHLAGQVAVTTSVINPREDFEINALGTLNVLEAMRQWGNHMSLIYSSTNKVYGKLDHHELTALPYRYEFAHLHEGVHEKENLDFYSPYGCSKGAADQYVRDYARIFGLKTVVFRQSCIYGYRQFGLEDQGWVAWFTIAALLDKQITLYGDGKQVRDILFIDDLVRAYALAFKHIEQSAGQAYNIGGGASSSLSLLELLQFLETQLGRPLRVNFAAPRPGDQKIYISNGLKAHLDFDFTPQEKVLSGLKKLYHWVEEHQSLIQGNFNA